MSDIKLFRFSKNGAQELPGSTAPLEKGLHALMEKNLECFLGIRLVAGEYPPARTIMGASTPSFEKFCLSGTAQDGHYSLA